MESEESYGGHLGRPSERQFHLLSSIYFGQSSRDLQQIYLSSTATTTTTTTSSDINTRRPPQPLSELLELDLFSSSSQDEKKEEEEADEAIQNEVIWTPKWNKADLRGRCDAILPSGLRRTQSRRTRLAPFKCSCPKLDVDQMRQLRLDCLSSCRVIDYSTSKDYQDDDNQDEKLELFAPDGRLQVAVFGCLSRNKLARRLNLSRMIKKNNQQTRRRQQRPLQGHDLEEAKPRAVGDLASASLYHLERLCAEADLDLGRTLLESARSSGRQLLFAWRRRRQHPRVQLELDYPMRSSSVGWYNNHQQDSCYLIAARVARLDYDDYQHHHHMTRRELSSDSGIDNYKEEEEGLTRSNDDADMQQHGWNLKSKPKLRSEFRARLANLLELRAWIEAQGIVRYSLELFQSIIDCNQLFRLTTNSAGQQPLSVNQLKLFACVEGQKLRARLRFDWLEQCLSLAFNHYSRGRPVERDRPVLDTTKRLPPIDNMLIDETEELRFYGMLNLALSQLLRNHFLAEALHLLVHSVEQLMQLMMADNQQASTAATAGPILSIQIELKEHQLEMEAAKLILSRPGDSLKACLGFVVDEIGRICSGLPSIETLLEFQGRHQLISAVEGLEPVSADKHPLVGSKTSPTPCLEVLGPQDTLLDDTKGRISNLIDQAMWTSTTSFIRASRQMGRKGELPSWWQGRQVAQPDEVATRINHDDYDGHQMRQAKWTQHLREYQQIVELVNGFRAGSIDANSIDWLESFAADNNKNYLEEETSSSSDDRLEQLHFCGRQIRLLDFLIFKLNCQMMSQFHFGQLLRLDFAPSRELLIKSVKNERTLLAKLKADELLRFFERLRLQFDEIELAIDLEAAIEDYLNERWRAKQSQQPQLEQQLLLSGEDDQMMELDEFEDEQEDDARRDELQQEGQIPDEQTIHLEEPAATTTIGGYKMDDYDEDEELVNALAGNNANNVAQLFALSNPKGVPAGELAGDDFNRVAPLVACRLLVGRYEYLTRLVNQDLQQLARDVHFALRGLMFLSEFAPHLDDQQQAHLALDDERAMYLELVNELAGRTQLFSSMLTDSMRRLEESRTKLLHLNEIRSQVLSKIVLQFEDLMHELARKKLANANHEQDETMQQQQQQQQQTGNNTSIFVYSLDSIQETSEWAQKLELRLRFLSKLNDLLQNEGHLLARAKLKPLESNGIDNKDDNIDDEAESLEHRLRASILAKWAPLVERLASFWRLVDEFETQQVKWLNSDSRRIVYLQIVDSFQVFRSRAHLLKEQFDEEPPGAQDQNAHLRQQYEQIAENLAKFQRRLDEFARRRLPLFKFLTNRHLNDGHWLKLSQLAGGRQILAQNYTTVAQLLEVELIEQLVEQLEEMSRQASIEHELSLLLSAESTSSASGGLKKQLQMLEVSSHLATWTDQELELAAARFIRAKLQSADSSNQQLADRMASLSVACHSLIKRYLRLTGSMNLINRLPLALDLAANKPSDADRAIVLRSSKTLGSEQQLRPSLLIEFLRLFTNNLLESQTKISQTILKVGRQIQSIEGHLREIDVLLENVQHLNETDLERASRDSEHQLASLEVESRKLELEREILATKEALALERQREALRGRDECVRQISERAIPALRAATRALDCLGDGKSLRALRSVSRPRPARPIRLVIEAVCLLRNSSLLAVSKKQHLAIDAASTATRPSHTPVVQGASPQRLLLTTPERRIDFVSGQITDDYWPLAWRTMNGVHSTKFLADLRQVDKGNIPGATMRLIRRKYLSEFRLQTIERISREAALLARWLIAVDVFDRVINVVRPNYRRYLEADKCLGELFREVGARRQAIESIERSLELIQDSINSKVSQRVSLIDLLNECSHQADSMLVTRKQLASQLASLRDKHNELTLNRSQLVNRCFWRAFRLVYLDALRTEDHCQVVRLIRAQFRRGWGGGND